MANLNDGVLVLGSTGFIGSALVRRLDEAGHRVVALARSETEGVRGGVRFVRGSLEDAALIRSLLSECATLVYAAGLTTPSASANSPGLEIAGNLASLAQLLSFANDSADKRLVYLSSAGAVYGDCPPHCTESAPLRPRSYYGAGKAAAEAFIHACTATTGWRATVLRPSNIYGPGQLASKGFAVIPTLFASAASGQPFFVLGDGSTLRDYCHVADLAELVAKIVAEPRGAKLETYNAGSGETATVLQLISACERSSGRKIDVQFKPLRGIDVPNVSLDTSAVRVAYSWTPRISLEEGLAQTWCWMRERFVA